MSNEEKNLWKLEGTHWSFATMGGTDWMFATMRERNWSIVCNKESNGEELIDGKIGNKIKGIENKTILIDGQFDI